MSDDEDASFAYDSDDFYPIEEDERSTTMRAFDRAVVEQFGVDVVTGRDALAARGGDVEQAYELLLKTNDLRDYLTSIGAITTPLLDYRALLRYCGTNAADSTGATDDFVRRLPHELIRRYELAFVTHTDPLCAQQPAINSVCRNAPVQHNCYEEALGLAPSDPTLAPSVVLSRRLLSFLCTEVTARMHALQVEAMRRVDALLAANWALFRKPKGADRLDAVRARLLLPPTAVDTPAVAASLQLTCTKREHIALLRAPPYDLSNKAAHAATTLYAFGQYVKRRLRDELLRPHGRLLEGAFLRNAEPIVDVLLERHA